MLGSEQAQVGQQSGSEVMLGGSLAFLSVQAAVTLGAHSEVVGGCEQLHHERSVNVATGELQDSSHLRSSYTSVQAVPWKVSTHLKRLSNSRKAEIPLSPDIVKVISSWKILKEMRVPDDLTCLLRNLYVDMEKWTGSQSGKEYDKAVSCHFLS